MVTYKMHYVGRGPLRFKYGTPTSSLVSSTRPPNSVLEACAAVIVAKQVLPGERATAREAGGFFE